MFRIFTSGLIWVYVYGICVYVYVYWRETGQLTQMAGLQPGGM